MNVRKNAWLTPLGRAVTMTRIEDEGWLVAKAAEAAVMATSEFRIGTPQDTPSPPPAAATLKSQIAAPSIS